MLNDGDDQNLIDDEKINEERLMDELMNLKVEEVRALCKQCAVDEKGSKVDLVMRLSEKMSSRVTYNKVFGKVWGASGKYVGSHPIKLRKSMWKDRNMEVVRKKQREKKLGLR